MKPCCYNPTKARSLDFKKAELSVVEKELRVQKRELLKLNWYALAISILTKNDCSAACKLMGLVDHKKWGKERRERNARKQDTGLKDGD